LTLEEALDEIRRRDDIISANSGLLLDGIEVRLDRIHAPVSSSGVRMNPSTLGRT